MEPIESPDSSGEYGWVGPTLGIAWADEENGSVAPLVWLDPSRLDRSGFAGLVWGVARDAKDSGLLKDQCVETDGLRFGRVVLARLIADRDPSILASKFG